MKSGQHYDIVIIGGGVMGTATAYYLSREKKSKVLLVDQLPLKNSFNSSADHSRVFRVEYGEDEYFTNLAFESLSLWKKLEIEVRKKIYFNCGALLLGQEDKDHAMVSYDTLKKLGYSVALFDKKDLKKSFHSLMLIMQYWI